MHRGNPYGSAAYKWENYDLANPGGSLILTNTSTPISPANSLIYHKPKYDQLGFKQPTFSRHASEEEFKKMHLYRQPSSGLNLESSRMAEEEYYSANIPSTKNSEVSHKRNSNSKNNQKESTFFKGRNSGGKSTNPLKQTSSTTSTDNLVNHKSEKTFPSFIRNNANNTKSPVKPGSTKKGLSKENFRIIKRLGEGKFGNVFLARDTATGFILALKVVLRKKIINENLLVQFTRELKIQTFLDHPNIIKNYGFFHDEEHFYTLMELGADGQLYDLISNGQTLHEESTSFIIGNLLDAISLMHKYKILHRDIKPQNIVLVHGNVKLCDFGWAVNKKQELRSTFCGTPLYLSPELLQGAKYDQKVDLWAIGILAYELYFGVSPFNICQQQDLYKIVTDQVKFPQKRRVSKEFKEFINAILKKNPKQRSGCKQLMDLEFIRKYRQFQTCEQLCH